MECKDERDAGDAGEARDASETGDAGDAEMRFLSAILDFNSAQSPSTSKISPLVERVETSIVRNDYARRCACSKSQGCRSHVA